MIHGYDVSAYQAEKFPVTGIDFVIIKATEGSTYVNPRLAAQLAWARKNGLSVGFYHFGHTGNVEAQADFFLKTAKPQAGDHLWFDWESTGGKHPTNAEKDQWIKYVQTKAKGHRVGLYCNTSFWKDIDTTSFAGDGLWIADYVTAGKPRITADWKLHQHTDSPLDTDVADFASKAAMVAWAKPAAVAPERYPGADLSLFFGTKYKGSLMNVDKLLWHTTEGRTVVDYSGGAEAPTLTAAPDMTAKKLRWYQHFDINRSARALVNSTGGVETNTDDVVQVELVGTCDPATRDKWIREGRAGEFIFWPDAPDWALEGLADFSNWLLENHGVKIKSTVTWKAYPASYGANNGVRLTGAQWTAYTGHLGHEHAPDGNVHGDPGNLDWARIAQLATGSGTDMTLTAADIKAIFDADDVPAATPPFNNADYFEADGKTVANGTWSFKYTLSTVVRDVRDTIKRVKGLEEVAASVSSQVAAVAADIENIAVAGVDLDLLADKVADKLAARLAS